MKFTAFILCFTYACAAIAQSEDYIKLTIGDVKITENNSVADGTGGVVDLKNKSKTRDIELYRSSGLSITANMKVSSNNSRRSSTKSGSITVDVTYYMVYGDKKDKRTAQYVFYLDDERKFTAKEQFVFKNGLKPRQIKLSYTGQFSD